MSSQPRAGYSLMQIGLHWLIAIIVLFQLVFGEAMTHFVDAKEEGEALSATDALSVDLHYWFGISILGLVLIRLILRLATGAPETSDMAPMMRIAAKVTHWLFYGLLIVVPITGLLGYYVEGPFGDIHSWAKPVFIVLIVLHAAAALYHQFWLKDGLLMRMLKPAQDLR